VVLSVAYNDMSIPLANQIDLDLPLANQSLTGRSSVEARRKHRLLIGASLLTLFFVPQALQLFPILEGLQIVKFTAIGVALLFLNSREEIINRIRLRDAPQAKLIVAMLVLAAATIPFAIWPYGSLRYTVDAFAKNVIFVYLLLQTVRSDRDLRIIAAVMVAGCGVLVLPMITHIGPVVTYKADPTRIAVGGTYDANDLALLFDVAIPFAFFSVKSSRPAVKAILIASMLLMLIGMVKTESRGGLLGLLVVLAIILLRSSGQARKYTLMALAAAAVFFMFAAPPAYWNRMDTIYHYQGDYNLNEAGGRIMVWKNGLKMISASPLIGVGIGCFPMEHEKLSEVHLQMAAHNAFLQAAAELGVFGLLLFVGIITVSLNTARRVRHDIRQGLISAELSWLASATEASFLGFVTGAFFLSHAYSGIFCVLAAMGAILHSRYKKEKAKHAITEEIDYA
jgi:putative inorganic carbon (HCO3(-)) transporter